MSNSGYIPVDVSLSHIQGPSEVEVSEICEERKMNVAHGLAWSFHLGYLNLVLPREELTHTKKIITSGFDAD